MKITLTFDLYNPKTEVFVNGPYARGCLRQWPRFFRKTPFYVMAVRDRIKQAKAGQSIAEWPAALRCKREPS